MSHLLPRLALAAFLAAASAHATVLTFNISGAGFADDSAIPGNYGNRAASASTSSGGLTYGYGNFGEGYTPNVAAAFNQPASFFSNGYGALVNVAYAAGGIFNLTLTADPGFLVSLFSFDLAGLDSNYQINSVSVMSGATTLFTQSNVQVNGSSNGTGLTSFSFPTPLTASSLSVQFNATNLGSASQANVGIDNIRFSQVPEPSAVTLSLFAAAGLAFYLRRRRAPQI